MKDIAKYTGLSLGTISKYINGGKVREKNRKLIDKAIRELDFKVNEMARGLKTNESKTIGIIIPSMKNYFCTHLMSYTEMYLSKFGYSVIICNYREDPKVEREKINLLMKKQVDGLIVVPSGETISEIQEIILKKIPVVLVDRILPDMQCDAVVVNNFDISKKVVETLVERGHKRIAIICGPKKVSTAKERLNGFLEMHKKYHLEVDEKLIKFGDYYMHSGFMLCKDLLSLENRPSAIFVTNYDMTLGVIQAINEANIKIPSDISVVGFDNLPIFKVIKPSLSIVSQPMKELGDYVAKLVIDRLNDPTIPTKVIKLEAEFIMKDSISTPN
ncbi:substrate-binding domain-containing protein [Terrilactibacillus sp. BCM23-1]|uniref:Substrate-binding domain-containing protein n=1 Tax=Terrilactibacillus tamarindi TaxID=2599694 RepID=A0A6N8CQ68_9BACI|nr:substrate-binding domain-containing protein [Terrilactibacillus tamarindi]